MRKIADYQVIETIHLSTHSEVLRARCGSHKRPVILKRLNQEYPQPRERAQFRREFQLTQKLDLPGVIKAYDLLEDGNSLAMVLEDFGGRSLDRHLDEGTLSVEQLLQIFLQVLTTVEGLHQRKILHKDLTPGNIVWDPASGACRVIDFGISAELAQESPSQSPPNVLEGTLAYIAPEQTGRVNRCVDYRSDFYTLGCSMYHLLTGKPPFETQDPMELVHCHIARVPKAACEVREDLPAFVSDIVAKLMAKNADERYQHAEDLRRDLQRGLDGIQRGEELGGLALSEHTTYSQFSLPQRLIGREQEEEALLSSFARVAEGQVEWVLVTGPPGIGKSLLIQELHKPIAEKQGFFLSGKFDQFNRNLPYNGVRQAFEGFLQGLLTLPEVALDFWRERLAEALGGNAQVLIDLMPALELILGPQAPVAPLPSHEASNRLRIVFQEFVQAFASPEHPLVLFLDDLQWADGASLQLMAHLAEDPQARCLLFLGSYRDNELDEGLQELLEALAASDRRLTRLALQDLGLEQIQTFLAETLRAPDQKLAPLALCCQQKTGGNPFFLEQFLDALHRQGYFRYLPAEGHWDWQLEDIEDAGITDDILHLMLAKIETLSSDAQLLLQQAACIGNPFELGLLSVVQQKPYAECARILQEALEEGLLRPLGEDYKLAATAPEGDHDLRVAYRFLHDRMQQALYSMLDGPQKQQLHLHIGRALRGQLSAEERKERGFDIVGHLNLGADLLDDDAQRIALAKDNHAMAEQARNSGAFATALALLQKALELLGDEAWSKQREWTLQLASQAAEMAYLCNETESMQRWSEQVLNRGRDFFEKRGVLEVQIMASMGENDPQKALHISLDALAQLDVRFPPRPHKLHVVVELLKAKWALRGLSPEQLRRLPAMSDPRALSAMKLLAKMGAPAYTAAPGLMPLIPLRMVQLTARYGRSPYSAYALASFGLILCGALGDVDGGTGFGDLALQFAAEESSQNIGQKAQVEMIYNSFIRHWKAPLSQTLDPLLSGYYAGLHSGEFEFGAYCLSVRCSYAMHAGMVLPELEELALQTQQRLERIGQIPALIQTRLVHQVALNLMGQSPHPTRFEGPSFDESADLKRLLEESGKTNLLAFYLSRMWLCLLLGEWREGLDFSRQIEPLLGSTVGSHRTVRYAFTDALLKAAFWSQVGPADKKRFVRSIKGALKKLRRWSASCPANHRHKWALVQAELHRLQGRDAQARERYDQAIKGARDGGFLQDECQAWERAARFYLARGQSELGHFYLQNAHYLYTRWGAVAKVEQLELEYGQLQSPWAARTSTHRPKSTSRSTSSPLQELDLRTVLKASQAISQEIVVADLLRSVLQLALENAGAQSGALILEKDGRWVVEALLTPEQIAIHQSIPLNALDEDADFSEGIVHYVLRTRELVLLHDAGREGPFVRDPHVLRTQARSILCMPLLHKAELRGALYLENRLSSGAFSPERQELLQLLLAQAVISLENATLYEDLEEKVAARTLELQNQYQRLKEAQSQLVQSEKMASLGTLVAGIAHEINNPANFTYNGAQNVQKRLKEFGDTLFELLGDDPDPDAVELFSSHLDPLFDNLESITDGTQRIRSIVMGLRTFSRLDEAEYKREKLGEGLRSTLSLVEANYSRKLQFSLEIEADPPVECWPAQLNQVFMNVMVNACQAIVSAGPAEGKLSIRSYLHSPNVLAISFRDNGCGMPQEVIDRMFEPFYTTKEVGEGTGLGMSISYSIVEKHGGRMEVDSTPSQGTTLTILLPLRQESTKGQVSG